jgi:DNA primase|tara:strand:+ start:589 stop:2394 length:1806 start_codon:yes stop_codon:yes gene_type:complete
MAYPPSFVNEVRRSTDPLQTIGEVVDLKRRGSRWVGLCPFHSEKTPSFTVNEEGLWHCFGCTAGGDIFQFVMNQEGMEFPEAVRSLAERGGVPVPTELGRSRKAGQPSIDKNRVMAVLVAADGFYREQLHGVGGARAREFLAERGFEDNVVLHFGLGFAPDEWEAVQQYLVKAGFNEHELEAAGLVKRRETGKGTYDRLRDRIVFPIRDPRGRPVAFSGRIIGEGEPKYLNSPETITFTKSQTLYGLFEARESISSKGFVLLVEGNFDLIACAQYGLLNVVAPLGTAFTEDHARKLAHFTRKAVVEFDGDQAGQAAAERTVGILLGKGFQVNVVRLAPEHDPDSFLRAEGAEGFHVALSQSVTGLDFMIHRAGERADLDTPRGKAEALSLLLEFVVPISNRVERAEWITRLAERLQIEPHLVEVAAADVQAKGRLRQKRVRSTAESSEDQERVTSWKAQLEKVTLAERELLRAVLEHPEWREQLEEICPLDTIRDVRVRALLEAAAKCDADGVAVDTGNLLARVAQRGVSALMSRVRLEEKGPLDWDSARNCALGIYDDSLRRRLRELNKDIRDALEAGDHELFGHLNKEKITLAQRIGSV